MVSQRCATVPTLLVVSGTGRPKGHGRKKRPFPVHLDTHACGSPSYPLLHPAALARTHVPPCDRDKMALSEHKVDRGGCAYACRIVRRAAGWLGVTWAFGGGLMRDGFEVARPPQAWAIGVAAQLECPIGPEVK